ncbi:MAG: hypothetical protein OEV77_12400 [Nitrospira sp.]|nr:hypothetical protein [Nitrospira sp.]
MFALVRGFYFVNLLTVDVKPKDGAQRLPRRDVAHADAERPRVSIQSQQCEPTDAYVDEAERRLNTEAPSKTEEKIEIQPGAHAE